MVTKSVTEFKNYGKCVKLSNGIIEAIATVDLGPRIVFFGFVGGENVMCTKKDEFEPIQNTQMDAHFYPGATWNNTALSSTRMLSMPHSLAFIAAAIPAGPPPITTIS